jgi:hypothetical protein
VTLPFAITRHFLPPLVPYALSGKSFLDDLAAKIAAGPPKNPVGLVKQPVHTEPTVSEPSAASSNGASLEKETRDKMAAILAGSAVKVKTSDSVAEDESK